MSETITTLPAPAIELPPVPSKWEREHRAFLRLLPELLKTHAGKYVAIHEGQVEDSDASELALIERVLGRIGNVSFHVGLVCAEEEPPARLPHYRVPTTEGGK